MKILNYLNVLGKEYEYSVQEGIYYLLQNNNIVSQINRDGVIFYNGEVVGQSSENSKNEFVYTLKDDTQMTFQAKSIKNANILFFDYYLNIVKY
jgi:hypothetical protein